MRFSRKASVKADSASDTTTSAAPSIDDKSAGEASLPPSYPSPFKGGEIVFAGHGYQFYEAKVEKVEFQNDWRYFIHYQGWNKSWDEWLEVGCLMKHTEENLQKVLNDRQPLTYKSFLNVGRVSRIKLDTSFDAGGKKQESSSSLICHKRKRGHMVVKGKDNNTPVEKLVNISIPPTLKKQLMDDLKLINQMGKLVKLPRTPNVDDIMEKYRDSREMKDVISISVGEVLSGLHVYFNKALPVILLYNKERKQYEEATAHNVAPSAVYGAEHLLRLFVKLPELLSDLNIKMETLRELQKNLQDFLKFLQKNQSVFFLSTYHVPEDSGRCADENGD